MKLHNYVLTYDKRGIQIKKEGEHRDLDSVQYITEGYCPNYFNCFRGTEFERPFSTHAEEGTLCKYFDSLNEKKCQECWNREVESQDSEYETYLRLKEKYENKS